ncbi:MAG: hypothetical protein L3K05_06005, partial [Thermoplasmata archaeon]|nr:hypothetical protein [Thermoplasmata archaeon]
WSGRRALELGLVDRLGDREEALEELSRLTGVSSAKAIRVAPPRPFFERMFSGGLSSIGPGLTTAMRDSLEDALWDAVVRRP